MLMQPINEAMQVASITAVGSIPAEDSMLGFTARMYAMVINVVIPASISVFTLVLFCFSLNIFQTSFLIALQHVLLFEILRIKACHIRV